MKKLLFVIVALAASAIPAVAQVDTSSYGNNVLQNPLDLENKILENRLREQEIELQRLEIRRREIQLQQIRQQQIIQQETQLQQTPAKQQGIPKKRAQAPLMLTPTGTPPR